MNRIRDNVRRIPTLKGSWIIGIAQIKSKTEDDIGNSMILSYKLHHVHFFVRYHGVLQGIFEIH